MLASGLYLAQIPYFLLLSVTKDLVRSLHILWQIRAAAMFMEKLGYLIVSIKLKAGGPFIPSA